MIDLLQENFRIHKCFFFLSKNDSILIEQKVVSDGAKEALPQATHPAEESAALWRTGIDGPAHTS